MTIVMGKWYEMRMMKKKNEEIPVRRAGLREKKRWRRKLSEMWFGSLNRNSFWDENHEDDDDVKDEKRVADSSGLDSRHIRHHPK